MKKCGKCGRLKELSEFYSHPTGSQGVAHQCKTCHKACCAEYRKDNPERVANYTIRRREKRAGEIKTPLIPTKRRRVAEKSTKSLTSGDVDLMRDLREEYGMQYKEIAEKFDVAREVAYKVCNYVWRANG